ncbi:MAG: hypothetical protein AAGA97_00045 [Pseudomonadota bacterium]
MSIATGRLGKKNIFSGGGAAVILGILIIGIFFGGVSACIALIAGLSIFWVIFAYCACGALGMCVAAVYAVVKCNLKLGVGETRKSSETDTASFTIR